MSIREIITVPPWFSPFGADLGLSKATVPARTSSLVWARASRNGGVPDVPILSSGLYLGEKLQDPVDVFVRLLGMRTDLGPARMRNQTMHLLGHPAGVNVVVSRHDQGRRPNSLKALRAHAQGQIRAIKEGVG